MIQLPDSLFKLSNNEVSVWFISFDVSEDKITFLSSFLSEDEILKASKFRFKKDKNCSIITRGALRFLSSKYLKENPEDIKFKYGEYGKPYYNMETKLKFNVSHSGNMAVIGFVLNDDIGVDIEEIKTDFEVFDIASNYFSKLEIETLNELPKEKHVEYFYRCWTRKESFIKAKSQGLTFPLDSFSVSIHSDKKTELLETKWDEKEKSTWKLFTFSPHQNYIGAVSVQNKISNIEYFNINDYKIIR